jgi:glycosyltransferase involved in cell wall biosynthesis
MNNMMFALTRYLRDRGYDVKLFLQHDELSHFLPENDTFSNEFKQYTVENNWKGSHAGFLKSHTPAQIREMYKGIDFFIVSGLYMAHLQKAGINADVFFPHGSDLYYVPYMGKNMRFDQKLRNYSSYKLFSTQAQAIRNAHCVNHENLRPEYVTILKDLCVYDKTWYFGCPMVYHPQYSPGAIESFYSESQYHTLFQKLREENDFLTINQNQQSITTVEAQDNVGWRGKGADTVVKAFADFTRKTKAKTHIALLEYGADIEVIKKMVVDLGISDNVTWLPKMSRKDIMIGLSLSDFGIGQFTQGCVGGNTTWEALSLGKPLLHYYSEDMSTHKVFNNEFPAINVCSWEGISAVFCDFIDNSEKYRAMGEYNARWYADVFVKNSLDTYVSLIEEKRRSGNIETFVKEKVKEVNNKTVAIPVQ